MQGFLLRLLGLGEHARVLEREGGRERDLLEILQIELSECLIRATTHRQTAKHAAACPEREDDAPPHVRQLLLHVARHS